MDVVNVFCPMCGQSLAIEVNDLRKTMRCPRCREVHVAGDLVSLSTSVPARETLSPPSRRSAVVTPQALPSLRMIGDHSATSDTGETFSEGLHDTAEMAPLVLPIGAAPPRIPEPTREPSQPAAAGMVPPSAASDVHRVGAEPIAARSVASGILRGARSGVVRAVAIGQSGAVSASVALSHVLRFADRVDAGLYGKRAVVIVGAATGAVVVGPLVDLATDDAIAGAAFTILFGLVLLVLVLARIASFRDEDGLWSWALVLRRIRTAFEESWNFAKDFKSAERARQLVEGGRIIAAIGMVALALRQILQLLSVRGHHPHDSILSTVDTALHVGWFGVFGGGIAWWRGRDELEGAGERNEQLVEGAAVATVEASTRRLPNSIDVRDPVSLSRAASGHPHPLIADLIDALTTWRPRRFAYEDQYQASLLRHLLRVMPDAEPERECPIWSEDGAQRGRIDLLVGRCVLVELKRTLDTSSAQRALGQLQMYAEMWRGRGPIVLILCDIDAAWQSSFLGRGLEQMHSQGVPIIAVAAGATVRRRART